MQTFLCRWDRSALFIHTHTRVCAELWQHLCLLPASCAKTPSCLAKGDPTRRLIAIGFGPLAFHHIFLSHFIFLFPPSHFFSSIHPLHHYFLHHLSDPDLPLLCSSSFHPSFFIIPNHPAPFAVTLSASLYLTHIYTFTLSLSPVSLILNALLSPPSPFPL